MFWCCFPEELQNSAESGEIEAFTKPSCKKLGTVRKNGMVQSLG
jgi:hypothetical protein